MASVQIVLSIDQIRLQKGVLALEPHLFSREIELNNWERHISVGGICQLLSDIFRLMRGTYQLGGDNIS